MYFGDRCALFTRYCRNAVGAARFPQIYGIDLIVSGVQGSIHGRNDQRAGKRQMCANLYSRLRQ